jgi:hypothetical protein
LDDIHKSPRIGRPVTLLYIPKFSQVITGNRFGFIKIKVTGEVSLAPTLLKGSPRLPERMVDSLVEPLPWLFETDVRQHEAQ